MPGRRTILALAAGVALLAVVVGVPLGWTWWQARQAQSALEQAVTALQDRDVDAARDHVEDARTHADRLVATQHGVLGVGWRHLPVLPAADDFEVTLSLRG